MSQNNKKKYLNAYLSFTSSLSVRWNFKGWSMILEPVFSQEFREITQSFANECTDL